MKNIFAMIVFASLLASCAGNGNETEVELTAVDTVNVDSTSTTLDSAEVPSPVDTVTE